MKNSNEVFYVIQTSIFPKFTLPESKPPKSVWLGLFLADAENRIGQFYLSEVRQNIPEAVHSKWYRQAGAMLSRNGFKKTGKWRHSPIPSRMNGDDFEWVKIGSSNNHQVRTTPNASPEQCRYCKNKCCPYFNGGKQ